MRAADTSAFIGSIPPGEGKEISYRATLMTIKSSAEQMGGALTLIENALPVCYAAPPHVHHRDGEPWYVLEGGVPFSCSQLTLLAMLGAFIFLPKGIPHAFEVEGSAPVKMLPLSYPAGIEKYFDELGEPARERILPLPPEPLDLATLRVVANKYGQEILGPPAP